MLDSDFAVRLPVPDSKLSAHELFRMGMRYATGLDGPLDLIHAHALFDLAARYGSLEAKIYRRELDEEMDLTDVAQAHDVVRQWLRRDPAGLKGGTTEA